MTGRPLPPDHHVHSEWSYDTGADASMVAACRRAVEVGLPAVAFTEHVDDLEYAADSPIALRGLTRRPWPGTHHLDVEGYLACVAECRERFPQLRILTGVELGEPHLCATAARAVLATGAFERRLGSLHVVPWGGELVDSESLWEQVAPEQVTEALRGYFAELVLLAGSTADVEILAHIDFPRRYLPPGTPYREADFEPELRAVLAALAASGRALEINTRSAMASADLLRWWREAGGRAVSFGSDAHVPWRVGEHFEVAMDVAAAAGFGRGRDAFDLWRR